MQHHTVSLLGSKIHYWVEGSNNRPTIVMIHGYRGTHHGLQSIIDQLPRYNVICPDLPGFGASTPMTERSHDIEGYADAIIGLIHELKLKSVVLLGHSMGTLVAANIATREPKLVTRLIFINPIAEHPLRGLGWLRMAPGVWYHWLGGRALPEKLGHRLLTSQWLFLVGSAAMTKTQDPKLRHWIHYNHVTYMAQFDNRHTLLEAYRSSLRGLLTRQVTRITTPTLLIAGQIDAIAPIKGQRKLAAALANAKLVELPDVGHIIHYEKPREAAAAIREFLPVPRLADSAAAGSHA